MKLFQEGDRSKAVCSQCKELVTTTFSRRDVAFSDGRGEVKDLLVGVCDCCGTVVSTPAQSTPAIRDARRKDLRSLEAVLPAIYLEALDLVSHTIDNTTTLDFRKVLLTWCVHRYAQDQGRASRLVSDLQLAQSAFHEKRGHARRRLSMKISQRTADEIKSLIKTTALTQTEVIKSMVFGMQSEVLGSPKPAVLRELKALAQVYA